MSAEQFGALWYSPAQDRMPFPFRFRSAIATLEEYDRYRQAVRDAVKGPEHEHLRHALAVLGDPDLRIEVFGMAADAEIRHIACARGHVAVVTTQHPATDEIAVSPCRLRELASVIAAGIPVTVPGSSSAQILHRTDLDAPIDNYVDAADAIPPRHRYARLTRTSECGTIHITDGPRHGSSNTRRIHWFDIPDDGAYLETRSSTTISIRPGARAEICAAIDDELSRMQPLADRSRR